jgi:elongation factor P--beta-lysine ligase
MKEVQPSKIEAAAISAALNQYFDEKLSHPITTHGMNQSYNTNKHLTPWQINVLNNTDLPNERNILGWSGKLNKNKE